MKISTTLIIVLIAATATSSCFAMQPSANPPRPRKTASLKGVAQMGDAKKSGVFSNIHEYFSPQESKNTHETSKRLHEVNSIIERKLIINLNEDSFDSILSRIQKSEGQLRSLIIRSNGQIETQQQIQTILLRCPNLQELNVRYCRNAAAGIAAALALDQDGIRVNPNALHHLKKLNLSLSNPSADQIITIALHCPALEELDIDQCRNAPAGIAAALALDQDGIRVNPNALQHLKKLNLSHSNPFAEQIITIALHCPALEELDISGCRQGPAGIATTLALDQHGNRINPNALQQLKKITIVEVEANADEITMIALHCPALEELNIIGCLNAPAGIASALVDEDGNRINPRALQHLKKLNLSHSNPSAGQITTIAAHCLALKEVDGSWCRNVAAGIAAALVDEDGNRINPQALQQLTILNIGRNTTTRAQIEIIALHCPALEELDTLGCQNTATGIAQALTQNPTALQKLRILNLALTRPTDDEITTIAAHCLALKELNLYRCENAPAGIVAALAIDEDGNRVNPTVLQTLTKLNLGGCYASAEQIRSTALHCPALEELDISDFRQGPAGIAQALALDENGNRINPTALQQLKKINLEESNASADEVIAIALHCPALEEINVSLCQNAPAGIAAALALDENDNRINPTALQHIKKIITGRISQENRTILQNLLPGVEISQN